VSPAPLRLQTLRKRGPSFGRLRSSRALTPLRGWTKRIQIPKPRSRKKSLCARFTEALGEEPPFLERKETAAAKSRQQLVPFLDRKGARRTGISV
jgi:hypothetical protein